MPSELWPDKGAANDKPARVRTTRTFWKDRMVLRRSCGWKAWDENLLAVEEISGIVDLGLQDDQKLAMCQNGMSSSDVRHGSLVGKGHIPWLRAFASSQNGHSGSSAEPI